MKKPQRVHMVGIGGAGVSALARIFAEQGVHVTGSDLKESALVKNLGKIGIPISIGEHRAANLPARVDLVVHTNDAKLSNPELKAAKKRGIPVLNYPKAIPFATENQKVIGISGTHGKTTTTGMLANVLLEAKWDPTIIVGSQLSTLGSNARHGKGDYAVVEADEYKDAFHSYKTDIAVVNNVEADHLNYFKDYATIRRSFSKYVREIGREGLVLANADDAGARETIQELPCCTVLFGISETSDLQAQNINLTGPRTTFTAYYKGERLGDFKLRVPGLHNVKNALAVIGVASHIGVPMADIKAGLEGFPGTWRRFEYKGEKAGITVVDDFAHHPTELKATLEAAKERFGKRRIVAVFQPHFYGRLRDFFSDFADALTLADMVIVPPVFYVEGRENATQIRRRYNSETLAKKVQQKGTTATHSSDMDAALAEVLALARSGDVIMTIGAGNVTELGPKILRAIR